MTDTYCHHIYYRNIGYEMENYFNHISKTNIQKDDYLGNEPRFAKNQGAIMGRLRGDFGAIPGRLWDDFGAISGRFRGDFGDMYPSYYNPVIFFFSFILFFFPLHDFLNG